MSETDRTETDVQMGDDAPSSEHRRRPVDPAVRAPNEDDDGYDPYSDRPSAPEPLFEPDPWA